MAKRAKKSEKVEAVKEETKRLVLFCAELSGRRMIISETGDKIGDWSNEETANYDFPTAPFFLGYLKEKMDGQVFELRNIKDPAADEEFIGVCKLMEDKKAAERGKAEETSNETTTEITHFDLPVPHTEEALNQYRARIEDLTRQTYTIEAEKKSADDRYNAKLKQLDGDIKAVIKKIDLGGATGPVECTVTKNAKGKILKVVRNDTGMEVEGVSQTKLALGETKAPEAATETPADETNGGASETVLEICERDKDGNIRTVDAMDDQGQWVGVPFEDLSEGATVRLFEENGSAVKDGAGNTVFVTQGEIYETEEGVLMIKAFAIAEETEGPSEEELAEASDVVVAA